MKKIYSIILLFSFLTGAMQPIMPMIEYQLYSGNLIEFFDSGNGNPCDDLIQLLKKDCQDQQNDAQQSLLDDDYYPLALQTAAPPKAIIILDKGKLEIFISHHLKTRPFSINPPPPKLS
ncbi:MAG TPA: hypothetical protein VF181_07540 [Balneolaceae bacterium]